MYTPPTGLGDPCQRCGHRRVLHGQPWSMLSPWCIAYTDERFCDCSTFVEPNLPQGPQDVTGGPQERPGRVDD